MKRADRRRPDKRRAKPPGSPLAADADAVIAQAQVDQRAGRLDEAARLYRTILAAEPNSAKALHGHGLVLRDQGDFAGAEAEIGRALAIEPHNINARINLGRVLVAAGRWTAARAMFQSIVATAPGNASAWLRLGHLELKLEAYEAAEQAFRKVLALDPNNPRALALFAGALGSQGLTDEGLDAIERARAMAPEDPDVLALYAWMMRVVGRLDTAEKVARRLLASAVAPPSIWFTLGSILAEQGRFDEAASINRAGAERQASDSVPMVCAADLLLAGDLAPGFGLYHRSLSVEASRRVDAGINSWDGAMRPDLRLHVRAYQGLGDTLHFIRYLPLLAAGCGSVSFEAAPSLIRLLQPFARRHGIALGALDAAFPAYDRRVLLESLPHFFKTRSDSIPDNVPYLRAEPEAVARWRGRFGGFTGRKIGLVWAGNPAHSNGCSRSMPVEALRPLLELPGIDWFSLQVGPRAADLAQPGLDRIVDLAPDLTDFAETAGALEALDLLITVDTSIVHLAGALGRPAWLLLATGPDWRWLKSGETSAWYPSLRLFRQTTPRGWAELIGRVGEALAA